MRFPQIDGEFTVDVFSWLDDEAAENYDAFDWPAIRQQFALERAFFPDMVALMLDNTRSWSTLYGNEVLDLSYKLYGYMVRFDNRATETQGLELLGWLKR